jgi:hypothetical protein
VENQVAAAPQAAEGQSTPSETSGAEQPESVPGADIGAVALNGDQQSAMEEMAAGIVEESVLDKLENNVVSATFKGTTLVLSAGYLVWVLRTGALLASVAAAFPMWARFDPLPILAGKKRDRKKDEEQDENDTSEKDDWHEQRIRRLLDPTKSNDPNRE